jgi:hypothetical protein
VSLESACGGCCVGVEGGRGFVEKPKKKDKKVEYVL